MSPRVVDKAQRRAEIARTTLELLVERGIDGVSISQIARAAGIGKGTVYEYYDSKEELIYAALLAWVESVGREAQQQLESIADPAERLLALARAGVQPVLEDPRIMHLMLSATHLLLHDERFAGRHNIMQEMSRGYREALKGVLLDGVEQGVFRPEIAEQAEAIAVNLFAFLDGISFHYMIDPSYFDPLEQVEFHLRNVLEALRVRGSSPIR